MLCKVSLTNGLLTDAVVKPIPDRGRRATEHYGPSLAQALGVVSVQPIVVDLEYWRAKGLRTHLNRQPLPYRGYGGGFVPASPYVSMVQISPSQMSDDEVARIAAFDLLAYHEDRKAANPNFQGVRQGQNILPILFDFEGAFPMEVLGLDPGDPTTWQNLAFSGNVILREARSRSLGPLIRQVMASLPSRPMIGAVPRPWMTPIRAFEEWVDRAAAARDVAIREVIGP